MIILSPMLGENIVNCSDNVLKNKLWRMSEKIDGVRRMIYKDKYGHIEGVSRTNKPDPWITHIYDFLSAPWFPYDTVYDTELVDRVSYYNQISSYKLRQISNSKASQQFMTNKKDLMAVCFDMYRPHGDMRTARERDAELYSTFNGGRHGDPVVKVPVFGNVYGNDMETIRRIMKSITDREGEGMMLLNMDSIHIPGRSLDLIKVKRLREFVGQVIDFEMAKDTTKIAGGISALIVDVPGCTVPVRIGSGFSHAERLYLASHSPIGQYVEIESMGYSKNRNGGVSLSGPPIFKQFVA